MPTSKPPPKRKPNPKPKAAQPSQGDSQIAPEVTQYMRKLNHPMKKDIEAMRTIIRGIDGDIREGIKWNSPSFRTTEFFATVNIRARDGQERVWLILHMGAKPKKSGIDRAKIPDPSGLLEWLGKDRCLISFRDGKDIQAKRPALEAILRAWIKQL